MTQHLDILRQIVSTPKDDPAGRLRATLFPEQLATVDETTKRAARLCSRRAGKTSSIMRRQLIRRLENPKTTGIYFATTLKAARKLTWDSVDSIPFLIDSLKLPATYSNSEHRESANAVDDSAGWPRQQVIVQIEHERDDAHAF